MGSASSVVGAALLAFAACGGGGGVAAVGPLPPPTFPVFEERTAAAGIDMPHRMIDSYLSMGTAFGDYDRDGDLDLYLTNARGPNRLYRNRGDGTFEESPVSGQVALVSHSSGGCVFADYDNDGFPDLYVCGMGSNVLLHNDAGLGFTDVTALARVGDAGAGITASFGDYDADGWIDLYVANYMCESCPGDVLANMSDRLYRNKGDGTFDEVTSLLGLEFTRGYGFVGSFVDYDADGDADIYAVNDKGFPGDLPVGRPVNRNMLYRNDGWSAALGRWVFTEVSQAAGADARINGMGLGVCDYDNDGDQDLAISDSAPPTVLRNNGLGGFESVGAQLGVNGMGDTWGVLWADFSNDRFGDLFFAHSYGPCWFYENRRNGTFGDVSLASGVDSPLFSLACAHADFDQDGWLDLVVGEHGSGYRLFRNRGLTPNPGWLSVRLEGSGNVNRDAIGARVRLWTVDGVMQTQEVRCGSSLGAGCDLALHFGLGGFAIDRLEIRWPNSDVELVTGLAPNQEWRHRKP